MTYCLRDQSWLALTLRVAIAREVIKLQASPAVSPKSIKMATNNLPANINECSVDQLEAILAESEARLERATKEAEELEPKKSIPFLFKN